MRSDHTPFAIVRTRFKNGGSVTFCRIVIYAFLLILPLHLFAQSPSIKWGPEIIVHNQPIHGSDTVNADPVIRFRRTYGSEYGRMLHLASGKWLAAYTVSRNDGYQKDPGGGFQLEIAESSDDGKQWKAIGLLTDKGRDLDNAEMIRLPDGSIVLACRSVRWQESYQLLVYRSSDNGHTWNKLSTIDANEGRPGELGKPDKGVYEPHFYFLNDGRLAVMYANEKHVTDSTSYSQIISEKVSPDFGKTWGPEIWVAYQPGHNASRPGMPVWTKMKNGDYITVYEICGPEQCGIYYKTSSDGYNWSPGLGRQIPDQTGGPFIVSLSNGTLVVTSNRGNISVSTDYGQHWSLAERPWQHEVDYSKDWTQTLWWSLYPYHDNELIAMTSIKRKGGGHSIRIRIGKITTGK